MGVPSINGMVMMKMKTFPVVSLDGLEATLIFNVPMYYCSNLNFPHRTVANHLLLLFKLE